MDDAENNISQKKNANNKVDILYNSWLGMSLSAGSPWSQILYLSLESLRNSDLFTAEAG